MAFDHAKLKALREVAGWSQQEAARRAGVALGTYRDIEQGVRADPWYSTVTAIAKVFGVDCGYFTPDPMSGGVVEPAAPKPRGRPRKVDSPGEPDADEKPRKKPGG